MLINTLSLIRRNLILLLIILVAFLVRFSRIDFLPPSLNWDEVSHGFNAYSILKTSKDEWGRGFPLIFRAFGDYKLPVYIYLTAISEFFLGLTALAVRLPSILAGTTSVIFTYLLVDRLFKDKKMALVASLLMAVAPWGLFVSRIASEANVAAALIISGVYLFLVGATKKNKWALPLSALLFGFSVWTYNSARVFVPLFLVTLLFFYRSDLKSKLKKLPLTIYLSALIVLIFFIPMFYQLASKSGQARYGEVEILDTGTIARLVENRNNTNLPSPLPRVIHNKVTYLGINFTKNYFSHFSPSFLFSSGGSDFQFNVQEHGVLYWVNAPFIVVGLILLVRDHKKKESRLLLSWLVLSPVASSLTREAPHVLRSIVMLPIPMILSSLGLIYTYKLVRIKNFRILLVLVYIFILGISVEKYGTKAVFEYRESFSWSWQYGYEEVVDYARQNYDDYDKIIVTKGYGEPHEFFLFFWPWSPEDYQNDSNLIRFEQTNWFWVDRFDKFYFINDWQVEEMVLESGLAIDCAGQECLLVSTPQNVPPGWTRLDKINFLDGEPAFEVYEN